MHTLQRRIRKAKEEGIRWSAEDVARAEDEAAAMLEDPALREEIIGALVRKEIDKTED
jgi:uncharacterized protein (DUF736 family)